METKHENEIEIDVKELFLVLLKGWKKLLLSSVLMAVVVGLLNIYILPLKYSATTKLYVFPKTDSASSFSDVQLGSSLTQDYMEIIKGHAIVESVIENLDLDLEYEDLVDDLTIENEDNTRILEITVVNENPQQAENIADEFAQVSSAYISDKMDQDPPNILEKASVDDEPIGPKVIRNACIGFLAGFLFMSIILSVSYLLNDTLNDSESIERYLGLNTLAEVPDSSSMKEPKGRRQKKGKK